MAGAPSFPAGWSCALRARNWSRRRFQRAGFVQKDACQLLGISRRKLNYMIAREWASLTTAGGESAEGTQA